MLATDSSSGKRIKILKKSDEIPRILSWEAKRGIDLLKFLKELEEFGAAEALPKMEGRRMIVIVQPKKTQKKKS